MDILSTLQDSASSNLKAARAGLEHLLAATGADEVIVLTDTWDHQSRRESYRLVAVLAERIKFAKTPWPKNRHFNREDQGP